MFRDFPPQITSYPERSSGSSFCSILTATTEAKYAGRSREELGGVGEAGRGWERVGEAGRSWLKVEKLVSCPCLLKEMQLVNQICDFAEVTFLKSIEVSQFSERY